jgi:hypothetical protein
LLHECESGHAFFGAIGGEGRENHQLLTAPLNRDAWGDELASCSSSPEHAVHRYLAAD